MTQRIRLTFTKEGPLRYIGHLDFHNILERTIRRAGLRLAYSQGYHPKPKMHLASALPLGVASQAEVMDIWLLDDIDPATLPERLTRFAPPGLVVLTASIVNAKAPALQQALREATYEITFLEAAEETIRSGLEALMAAESWPRERRGKLYDLRPLLLAADLLPPDEEGHPRIRVRLSARPGATGRADEVAAALGQPPESTRIARVKMTFEGLGSARVQQEE